MAAAKGTAMLNPKTVEAGGADFYGSQCSKDPLDIEVSR